jgi:hypothetical protein
MLPQFSGLFSNLPAIFTGNVAEDGLQIEQGMSARFRSCEVCCNVLRNWRKARGQRLTCSGKDGTGGSVVDWKGFMRFSFLWDVTDDCSHILKVSIAIKLWPGLVRKGEHRMYISCISIRLKHLIARG